MAPRHQISSFQPPHRTRGVFRKKTWWTSRSSSWQRFVKTDSLVMSPPCCSCFLLLSMLCNVEGFPWVLYTATWRLAKYWLHKCCKSCQPDCLFSVQNVNPSSKNWALLWAQSEVRSLSLNLKALTQVFYFSTKLIKDQKINKMNTKVNILMNLKKDKCKCILSHMMKAFILPTYRKDECLACCFHSE